MEELLQLKEKLLEKSKFAHREEYDCLYADIQIINSAIEILKRFKDV